MKRDLVRTLALLAALGVVLFLPSTAKAGTSPPTAVYSVSSATGSGSVTVNKPAGVAPGDLLIVCLLHAGGSSQTLSGFTILDSAGGANCWYRIANGAEASSVSFTSTGNGTAALYYDIEYADQSSPFMDNQTSSQTGSGTAITVPSVNPTQAPSLEMAVAGGTSSPYAYGITAPSGWTLDANPQGANTTASVTLAGIEIDRSSTGSTGTSSATASGSLSSRYSFAFAITPATSQAPVARTLPLLSTSGSPGVGQMLSATDATWSELPTGTTSWQWQRDTAGNDSYTDISGATGSSYTTTSADAGDQVRVVATRTNSAGTSSVASKPVLVAGSAVTVRSVTTATNSGSNVTVNKPSTVQAGDLLLVYLASGSSPPQDLSGQGFTLDHEVSPGGRSVYCFWKIADGSEASSITFSLSSSSTAASAAYVDIGNEDPAHPFEDDQMWSTTTSGSSASILKTSPTDASTLELAAAGGFTSWQQGYPGLTAPSGWTDKADAYGWVSTAWSALEIAAISRTTTADNASASVTSAATLASGRFGEALVIHPALSSPAATLSAAQVYGGSNPAEPGACGCDQMVGKPVNTENGDTYETTTDAHVATYGPPLTFTRTYDSLLAQSEEAASTPGPLGYGWTDNWNASLKLNSPAAGDITVVQPNGAQVAFYPPSGGSCPSPYVGPGTTGTYCALPSVTASLTYDSGSSTYTFVTHPYTSYTFNSTGQLTAESGPGGAQLSLAYGTPSPGSGDCPSAASSCFTVTSASGRALVVASNSSGLVTQVEDPLNRVWTYSYTSNLLTSVTDPLGHLTSFTYDTGNSNTNLRADLLTETMPNGQTGGPDAGDKLVNTFNSGGQVATQTDPGGNLTSFNYSNMNASNGYGYTLVTDPDGNVTRYDFAAGALTKKTEGYGTSSPSNWTYTVNLSTLLRSSITDPDGRTTGYTYDANGNLVAKTNPLGNTWTYAYNGYDEQTCETLPLASSGCASLSPPAAVTGGGTISPPSAAPPKYATYREYDTDGNLVWTSTGDYAPGSSSASQSRTTYSLSNGESVTLGMSTDSCNASAPSSMLPCATIDPNGVVTQLGYSSAGDLTSSSTPDGNTGGEQAETTYTYDADGELLTTTAPKGNLSGASAADYTTTNTYTDDGQLHTSTVSQTGGGITARETVYGYDPNGNRVSVVDARGKETDSTYDANDRLTLVSDPDGHQTLTCYDGDGNIAETVPAVGVAANSLTPASCPSSYPSGYGDRLATDATTIAYDALGDRTTITTPAPTGHSSDGYETTTNVYDSAGQLISTTAPPASNDTGASSQVSEYSYDSAGELLARTNGYGTSAASTSSYCYDPNGDKTASVAPDGNTGGVASCSSSSPWQTSSSYQTGYSYDSLGELVSETRPATSAAPSGQTTSFSYDPAGNVLTSEDANGVTASYTYTPLNQLSGISYSDSTHSVSIGYDANGNRVSLSDASGSSSYSYDVFDELVSATNGASQEVDYTYNADGQVASITYPIGSPSWAASDSVSYSYDDAGLMTSVTDFNGNTVSVANTADGLPNSLSLGSSGDTVSTSYDPTGAPSQITLTDSGSSTLLDYSYSDTPAGTIASETDTPSSSLSPAAYTYDAQSRVTSMTPGSSSALSYGYDASGNLTTLPTGASGSYDNGSELTSSTLSGTTTSYTYDAAGQRAGESQGGTSIASASYNGAHELTSYSNPSADMSAATYNADGLRTAETSTPAGGSAQTEAFVWDTVSSSVPHLLMDSENAYVYGPGDTPLEQVKLADGSISYLVADSLGSVRGVVDGSDGSLEDSTSYDAWGNPETSGGLSNETPFGYAGGYTDPTGVVYLVHRYYDPQTGQFLSVDPRVDETEAPYVYVNDDPVIGIDLLGLGCGWSSPWDCASSALSATEAGVNDYANELDAVGNAALPYIHQGSQILAFMAGACAIATSETVVGGVTCGAIALAASGVAAGTGAMLYAQCRESSSAALLDVGSFITAGIGSAFELASGAAREWSLSAKGVSELRLAEARSAPWYGKAGPLVSSGWWSAKSAVWDSVSSGLQVGSRVASVSGEGAGIFGEMQGEGQR